jgi:hypothetical protein
VFVSVFCSALLVLQTCAAGQLRVWLLEFRQAIAATAEFWRVASNGRCRGCGRSFEGPCLLLQATALFTLWHRMCGSGLGSLQTELEYTW